MTFADRLKELREGATPGRWQAMRDGNQYVETRYMPTEKCVGASRIDGILRPWNPHAAIAFGIRAEQHEVARFLDADADFITFLANHAAAIEALVRAAEHADCACSIKEALSGHLTGCWKPDLMDALASLSSKE